MSYKAKMIQILKRNSKIDLSKCQFSYIGCDYGNFVNASLNRVVICYLEDRGNGIKIKYLINDYQPL